MFRTYVWEMAAVPLYSYEHPFALDQMFPQANPLSNKVTTANTRSTSTNISDRYISQKLQWRQNDYKPYETQSCCT
jgi:hypothetical protein